jgi:phage/plasmid-like protein (TIGR03299 family)
MDRDDTDTGAIERFRRLELDDAPPPSGAPVNAEPETGIRRIELAPGAPAPVEMAARPRICSAWGYRHIYPGSRACRCGAVRPAATVAPAPAPARVTVIDAPRAPGDIDARRVAHGVTRQGEGRGTSRARMGRDARADQYCEARTGIGSAREAREMFGLDWTVSKRAITVEGGIPARDHAAIVRDDTGEVMGIVGARYAPLQNDVLDILDAIRDEAPIVRGGVWDGGRRVWLQTALGSYDTPSGPMEGTALAATSHDGSLSLWYTSGGNVVVCRNTFRRNLATAPNAISIRHTAGAGAAVERMRDALAGARDNLIAMTGEMMSWGRTKISAADITRYLAEYLPAPAGRAGEETGKRAIASHAERIGQWRDAYARAPGAMPGTAWGIAMATTYYADHIRAVRSGTDRMERAWTDGGTERALQMVSVIAKG